MTTAVIWHDDFAVHDMGRGGLYLPVGGLVEDDIFIDNTERIVRTRNLLRTAGVEAALQLVVPSPATLDQLTRAHSESHVARMRDVSKSGGGDAGGGYTPMEARSYELARLSAGSAIAAVELVVSGELRTAHAMVRRSGHHAWADSGYGFCVFNNCAVAARTAQVEHGIGRVAIVDIDVHHGNGTEAIFYDDPSVLTVSIHQDRSFPVDTGGVDAVGDGNGRGLNVNINLPAGSGDPAYADALDRIVIPVLLEFRPDLLLVACGVDANLFDPLARNAVTARGFAMISERLAAAADEVCGGRLVTVQEGGYSHVYAPLCWLAVIETIAGLERHNDPFEDFIAGQPCCRQFAPWQQEANDATIRVLAPYWSTL